MATDEVSAEVHDGQAAPWRRDRDFDLERMGFSLSVLDETKKRETREANLGMSLAEIADRIFTNADATPGSDHCSR